MRERAARAQAARAVGYPRLRAAWRALAAAPFAVAAAAHADASLPSGSRVVGARPGGSTVEQTGAAAGSPTGTKGEAPSPPSTPHFIPHRLGGRPMMPRLHASDVARRVAIAGERAIVLHPHGPDEPCPVGDEDA